MKSRVCAIAGKKSSFGSLQLRKARYQLDLHQTTIGIQAEKRERAVLETNRATETNLTRY
jgi:hypothetical protein